MTKVANYTAEQTVELVKGYAEGKTVEALSTHFGKSVRSITMKLSREGVYTPKEKVTGKRAMLKAEMVSEIATILGADEDVLGSLEKATGPALMLVLEGLKG